MKANITSNLNQTYPSLSASHLQAHDLRERRTITIENAGVKSIWQVATVKAKCVGGSHKRLQRCKQGALHRQRKFEEEEEEDTTASPEELRR